MRRAVSVEELDRAARLIGFMLLLPVNKHLINACCGALVK
jgi:hypothetical protein